MNDMGAAYDPDSWDAWTAKMRDRHGNGNGHGKSLSIEAQRLLPTPNTLDSIGPRSDEALARARTKGGCSNLKDVRTQEWGDYADAIARWEPIIGRPAPDPTEPGRNGRPRLSPRFVEWLMGLPEGHVCDTPDVSRTQALKMLGNGVVPQQASEALRRLLSVSEEVAA